MKGKPCRRIKTSKFVIARKLNARKEEFAQKDALSWQNDSLLFKIFMIDYIFYQFNTNESNKRNNYNGYHCLAI